MLSFADIETNFRGNDAAAARADHRRRNRERAFRADLPTRGLARRDLAAETRGYRKLEKLVAA